VRTTIQIDDALYRELKAEAARGGRTISHLIEDAVRAALAQSRGIGGLMPGVNLTTNAALRDVMDEDTALDALRRRHTSADKRAAQPSPRAPFRA
jgi:hypothetical protein